MKLFRHLPGWFLGACALCATATVAQADDPVDSSVDVQLFDLAVGPHAFLSVDGATLLAPRAFHIAMMIQYARDPLTIYNVDPATNEMTDVRAHVVQSMVEGQLVGAYGLMPKLQLGVALPITLSMTGDGLDVATGRADPNGLSVTGLGDARIEAAYQFYRQGNISITANPAITVPTSTSDQWLGDSKPGFIPRAAAEWQDPSGKISAAANLGFLARWPHTVYSSRISSQLLYGAAGRYRFTDRIDVVAELFGRKGLRGEVDELPLEAGGGVRLGLTSTLTLLAGGGAGLIRGLGTPTYRVFGVVNWSQDYGDSDGDGVANAHDRCPIVAEDRDGFEDDDGCPDLDNDHDFVEDAMDACPDKAEDKDGYDDEDGCPDPDNDMDGLLDADDRCPSLPEDKKPPHPDDGCPASSRDSDGDGLNDDVDKCPADLEDEDGFQDEDGCPDPDNDNDGVKDEDDRCPAEAEDRDGFDDYDGCPDVDNDKDGFLDAEDKCPTQPEVINGVKDDDGCPDKGGQELVRYANKRLIFVREPRFDRGGRIGKGSRPQLEQAALHMRRHREVTKWRIVAAISKRTRVKDKHAYANQLAATAMAFFVDHGVPADRMETMGAVTDRDRFGVVGVEFEEEKPPPKPAGGDGGPEPVIVDDDGGAAAPPARVNPDKDRDGITGDADKCPDQPETINGVDDDDGCPDTGGEVLAKLEGKRIDLIKPITFGAGTKIDPEGEKVMAQVAAHMRAYPEIGWRIVVAAKTKELAQKRADVMRELLGALDVPTEHIETIGVAGKEDKIGFVAVSVEE